MGGALYEDYGMHPQDAESCEYRQEELRMDRMVGTVSRGIRAPIIRQGDDLAKIVVDSVLAAAGSEPFEIRDKDVIAVTEAEMCIRDRSSRPKLAQGSSPAAAVSSGWAKKPNTFTR